MFYKLIKFFVVLRDSISVAFEFISAHFSSFLSYNARIAPSEELRNLLEILFKINSN